MERVDAAIAAMRRAWAAASAQGSIRGLGRVQAVRSPLERVTLACERLLGVAETPAHRDAPRLSGLRELYDLATGDYERRGMFRAERVTLANATTSTMAQVVANALNKALLQAYEARPAWWQPLASEEDFPTMNAARWVTLGGSATSTTVSEGAAYTEKTWDDSAESASFVKKGNYLGITLEMIDRDDVAAVRAIPKRLAYAARRTLLLGHRRAVPANSGVGQPSPIAKRCSTPTTTTSAPRRWTPTPGTLASRRCGSRPSSTAPSAWACARAGASSPSSWKRRR